MNKKTLILLLILLFVVAGTMALLSGQISLPRLGPAKEEVATVGGKIEAQPPTLTAWTRYTDEEFGFSLSYPSDWGIPVEGWIEPPSQHLHQIVLNPDTEEQYLVDIYSQPSPISLINFINAYFGEIEAGPSEIEEVTINGNEAVKFFMAKAGLTPKGIGKIGFRKNPYIVIISTPLTEGETKTILADEDLNQIAESFEWRKQTE